MQIKNNKSEQYPHKKVGGLPLGSCFWSREYGLCIRSKDEVCDVLGINLADGCCTELSEDFYVYPVDAVVEWDDSVTRVK